MILSKLLWADSCWEAFAEMESWGKDLGSTFVWNSLRQEGLEEDPDTQVPWRATVDIDESEMR